MPILSQDVGFYVSERLTDYADGGGRITGQPVIDGQSNNLFADQSDLDETYGRLNLRKAGVAVRSDDADPYLGVYLFLTKPPFNEKVSVTLFRTGQARHYDERNDAKRFVESYRTAGSESAYTLLGGQLAGQRMLFAFAREGVLPPDVGAAFALDDTASGEVQFVRVTDVKEEVREYEDGDGVFKKSVFTLGISTKLRRNFVGSEVFRKDRDIKPDAVLRTTQIADAAKYYGIQPLDAPASLGDMSVKAKSLFSQLVPSATVESTVTDVLAGADHKVLVQTGDPFSVNGFSSSGEFSFGRALMPGTLQTLYGVDDGNGDIWNNGIKVGTVDYESGAITLPVSGGATLTAAPAVVVTQAAHTDSIAIEAVNRGYNYTRTLRPVPDFTGLVIDWRSQGNWYRLKDIGGELRDDVGSVAQLDRQSGTVIITLAALPDVDSQILLSWASPVHFESNAGFQHWISPYIEGSVTEGVIAPNSLTISWTDRNGTRRSVTDDGLGALSGDGSGRVVYATGEWGFTPDLSTLPGPGALFDIEYDATTIVTELLAPTATSGGVANFTLTQTPIKPGSVTAVWSTTLQSTAQSVRTITPKVIFGTFRYTGGGFGTGGGGGGYSGGGGRSSGGRTSRLTIYGS